MFKKLCTSILLTLVGVGGFLWVNVDFPDRWNPIELITSTYAACQWDACQQWVEDRQNQNPEIQKMLNTLVAAVNVALGIITIIVTPAIMLAGWLMSPDWTAGDLFGIRPIMHSLWIIVSNITYLIYAILLIFIALATIFNSEHYGYKAMLPKLALGIIMVPLTWWMVQFTISLATYLTAAAVDVPAEALQKYTSDKSWWNTAIIPSKMSYKNGEAVDGKNTKIGNDYCTKGGDCLKPSEITANAGWLFSPLLIYSFWVFKIQDIQKIDNTTDVVKSIMQLINQWIIGALMFLVFGILVIWLIFMLLMRAIKLWLYAIFSPLFTIKFVFGEKAFGDADKDGSFNITEFIWLAFVPAVVSLALSFWLIIIAGMTSPTANDPNNKCEGEKCTIIIMGNTQNSIVSTNKDNTSNTVVTMGWISYTFEWKTQWWAVVVPALSSALSLTGNFFGTIIIDIIALMFIWIAFMAGKGVSKAAGKAIEPFENMGNQIGKLGMSLPKYAPIPGTGGLSMKSMEKVPQSLNTAIETSEAKRFEGSKLWQVLQADKYISPESVKQIKEWINRGTKDWYMEVMKNTQAYHDRPNSHNGWQVEDFVKKMKDDPQYLNVLGVDPKMKASLEEYSKKDLKNEDVRKQIWSMMRQISWVSPTWGTEGKTGNNSSWYTMWKNEIKGNIVMNIWWESIHIDKIEWKSNDETTTAILKWIKNSEEHFKKHPINEEDLRKLLEATVDKVVASKVIQGIDPNMKIKKKEETAAKPPWAA